VTPRNDSVALPENFTTPVPNPIPILTLTLILNQGGEILRERPTA